ncbi:hypothetical protein Goari_011467 [Gossypium aridum]|uniref:Uncharacterized protein n=1 Tax=Gossypium aridum TaxID=34290 RepID=A0A7J8WXP7_GOSAI|nr:hypothetical protein [Gossypium aridum]
MAPRKPRRTSELQQSVATNPSSFSNLNVKNFFRTSRKDVYTRMRWERFCVTPKDSTIVLVVQEFYASFRDQESRRPEGANWETIRYEGKRCSSPLEQFKKQVCIRTWIHHNMKRCINGQKVKSNIPHIKWMIRWMQETGLVLQEFVRLNNMRVQNYSPELFGPIHSYYEAEKKGREEREENEDDKGEEEGDEIDFEEEDD